MKPILKYNGGKGAVLCENCRVIVESGFAGLELEVIRNLKVPCFCSECDDKKNKTFCDTFEVAIDKVLTQNGKERLKMKTIAQQLNITEFPFQIFDSKGNKIYGEDSNGFWYKREYDSNGKEIYWEDSNGFWYKREYDSNENVIYLENSNGIMFDNRPKKELTMSEIADKFGIPIEQLKITKG